MKALTGVLVLGGCLALLGIAIGRLSRLRDWKERDMAALHVTPRKTGKWKHTLALFGCTLVVLGVFLPWIQLGTLVINRGINGPDGAILLGFALAIGFASAYGIAIERRWLGLVYVLGAIALFCVGLIDLADAQERIQELKGTMLQGAADVGAGIYILLAGAAIVGLAGLCTLLGPGRNREGGEGGDNATTTLSAW